MGFLKPPKPPKPPEPPEPPPVIDYSEDVTESPDIAVPIPEDGGSKARKRMAASRRRTGRSALQIPKGSGNAGLSIPK